MELTVDQSALSRALRLVSRVTPTRPTLPILQMVLLGAESGRLRLTATDAELAMTTAVAAEVASEGRVAIPARLLGEYVAHLPAEPVRLSFDPARTRWRAACGPFVANLATADPAEFPAFWTTDDRSAVDLEAGRLRRAVERVAFAAARDESRPVLSGVLFDFGPEGLTLAAADGFRLARRFGREVSYSVLPYDGELHARVFGDARSRLNLLLGCVDNSAARRAIAASLDERRWGYAYPRPPQPAGSWTPATGGTAARCCWAMRPERRGYAGRSSPPASCAGRCPLRASNGPTCSTHRPRRGRCRTAPRPSSPASRDRP